MSAASACQGDGVVWGLCALPPPIRVATMNKDAMNKDTLLQRAVAVKIVDLAGATDPAMAERFRREGIAEQLVDAGATGVQ